MANKEHLDILKQGARVWNRWREEQVSIAPDLREANLSGANLNGANLSEANFRGADLSKATLHKADFSGANLIWTKLREANLVGADLSEANLSGADLSKVYLSKANLSTTNLSVAYLKEANFRGADLSGAYLKEANLSRADLSKTNLSRANLSRANLSRANLSEANLSKVNLSEANLTGCRIFGISAWNVNLEGAIQKNLIITGYDEPEITVDNLKVAQFIYLLLHNEEIRDVIDTITSKVVLILGRFTDERKPVLNALRDELSKYNYSPVVFDFDPSAKRDLMETISTLAHLSRFVIADLTDAKSLPQELERIVPHLPSVPVQPILHRDDTEYAMFESYKRYPWVLPIYHYQDIPSLLASIKEYILKPIEQKEYEKDRAKTLEERVRILEEENKRLKRGM